MTLSNFPTIVGCKLVCNSHNPVSPSMLLPFRIRGVTGAHIQQSPCEGQGKPRTGRKVHPRVSPVSHCLKSFFSDRSQQFLMKKPEPGLPPYFVCPQEALFQQISQTKLNCFWNIDFKENHENLVSFSSFNYEVITRMFVSDKRGEFAASWSLSLEEVGRNSFLVNPSQVQHSRGHGSDPLWLYTPPTFHWFYPWHLPHVCKSAYAGSSQPNTLADMNSFTVSRNLSYVITHISEPRQVHFHECFM